jgi:class 3 adenylate cyclase
MSPTDPSSSRRPSTVPGRQSEVGLVVVDIDYHDRLYSTYSADDLRYAKKLVVEAFCTVAEARGGALYSWEGDQGVFKFPVEDGAGLDNFGTAAALMLDVVPSLCEDIRSSADLERPLTVRIACDSGKIPAGSEAHGVCQRLLAGLAGAERPHGDDVVTVTGRVYGRLSRELKDRFVGRRYSNSLGVDLHSTSTFPAEAPVPQPPPPKGSPVATDLPGPPDFVTDRGQAREIAVGTPRLDGRPVTWFLAGVAVMALLIAGYSLVRRGEPRAPAAPVEPARPDAWTAWRTLVHERLSDSEPTEDAMREILEARPPAAESSPAAALRHDQATAEVLLGYKSVRAILKKLVGIDEHFLGTGLSKPVDILDYREASVHEYLISNLRDDDPNVWMTKLNPFILDQKKTIKKLVEEEGGDDEAARLLKREITSRCEAKERGAVVIRFALFDEKYYKHTLGPPDRVRVFASDLSEVWDLGVKDAADRSGYGFTGGNTFFIWIFVTRHKGEATPATWGRVLENLPAWMKEAKDRSAAGAASPESRPTPPTAPKRPESVKPDTTSGSTPTRGKAGLD